MQLCLPLGRGGREEQDVWERERQCTCLSGYGFIWWQRCSDPTYDWRLSHWDSHSETFFKSLWPRPTILFLRNSFQKRTFLMPNLKLTTGILHGISSVVLSTLSYLMNTTSSTYKFFPTSPLTRGLCSVRLGVTYLWTPQSQLGGGTPSVPFWFLPGTAQP